MGFMDGFTSDGTVDMKHTEYYNLMKEAAKAELLSNAVKAEVPGFYVQAMITGERTEANTRKRTRRTRKATKWRAKRKVRNRTMAMNELRKEVEAAAMAELNRANAKFPLFNSTHEGYAVILEEAEEAQEAMENVKTSLAVLWDRVKGIEVACFLDEDTTPTAISTRPLTPLVKWCRRRPCF